MVWFSVLLNFLVVMMKFGIIIVCVMVSCC